MTDDDPTTAGTDEASESAAGMGTWEPRPMPDASPETERFWRGAAEGEFLLCECSECGLVYHYPRALCPDCFSSAITWREASGEGEIYSYSSARRVSGWPESALPLVVAYVTLEEGPRVMTNLVDCDREEIEVGTRVEVRYVETATPDVAIPVFVPVDI